MNATHTQLNQEPEPGEQDVRSENPLPFVLPLIAFMVIAMFYPNFSDAFPTGEPLVENAPLSTQTVIYLVMIGIQVLVGGCLVGYFRRTYLQHFPFRISPLAVITGIVGVVAWVGLCDLQLEPKLLAMVGWNVERPAFNPFTIQQDNIRLVFLILRFTVLALLVPIIEEIFLRGWLVRWVENPAWEHVGFAGLSMGALLTASIYGMLTHPSEAIAAFIWFGLVTGLMVYTKNLWDCVLAHAVTNLLLGIYVLQYSQWHLW